MSEKLRVGVFGITGCAGCQLSIIFNEDELLDLVELVELKAFPFIKEVNIEDEFDYLFLEGLVASESDLETVKKLREKTKVLIALGACAATGCVPAYRHFTLKENYTHLLYKKHDKDVEPTPVHHHVKVDYTVPGCPPSKKEILNLIKNLARGVVPIPINDPVCVECRRNRNVCLLEEGKPCLGPITRGGCDSICINGGLECWGCRGPTPDMNLELMIKILREKGFDDRFIQNRMRTFAGLELPVLERLLNGNDHSS